MAWRWITKASLRLLSIQESAKLPLAISSRLKSLELEEILKTNATKDDVEAVLKELGAMKPSAGFEWLGRIADLIAVFDASIKVLPFLM